MDSLKLIQKTFRIFLRLTHAAKILCIVGTVLSGVGALSPVQHLTAERVDTF